MSMQILQLAAFDSTLPLPGQAYEKWWRRIFSCEYNAGLFHSLSDYQIARSTSHRLGCLDLFSWLY